MSKDGPDDLQFKRGRGRPAEESIRLTRAARQRLDALAAENADAIFQAILGAAMDGDMGAARLLADRIWPSRKGTPVTFTAPRIQTATDIPAAYEWLLSEVGAGVLTPDEGDRIGSLIERRAKAFESVELQAEVASLREQLDAILGPRAA